MDSSIGRDTLVHEFCNTVIHKKDDRRRLAREWFHCLRVTAWRCVAFAVTLTLATIRRLLAACRLAVEISEDKVGLALALAHRKNRHVARGTV